MAQFIKKLTNPEGQLKKSFAYVKKPVFILICSLGVTRH